MAVQAGRAAHHMIAFSFFFPSCPLIPSPFCLNNYSAASTMHLTKLHPRPTRIPSPLLVVVMKGFSRGTLAVAFSRKMTWCLWIMPPKFPSRRSPSFSSALTFRRTTPRCCWYSRTRRWGDLVH
jgi:hypothetical protein